MNGVGDIEHNDSRFVSRIFLTDFDDVLRKFYHAEMSLLVYAGAGDDEIDIRDVHKFGNEVHGGSGNDTIRTGSGYDRLYGDAGNDVLSGGRGADILDGGSGHDFLFSGVKDREKGNGPDYLSGGSGRDIFFSGPIDSMLDVDNSNWLNGLVESKALSGVFLTGSIIKESASVMITTLGPTFKALPYAGPLIGLIVDMATRGVFLGSKKDDHPEEAASFRNVAVVADFNPIEGDIAIQHFTTSGFRNIQSSLDGAAHALLIKDADVTLMRINIDKSLPGRLEALLKEHGLQQNLPSHGVFVDEMLDQAMTTSLVLYKHDGDLFFATPEEISRGMGRLSEHRHQLAGLPEDMRSENESALGALHGMLDDLETAGAELQDGDGVIVFGSRGGVFYELNASEKNVSVGVGSASDDVMFGQSQKAWTDAGLDLSDRQPTRAFLFGFEGDDRLYGHGGRDVILGGEGDDLIAGGAGSDTLLGGGGDDIIHCGRRPEEVAEILEHLDTGSPYGAALRRAAYRNAVDDYDDYASGGEGNDKIYGSHGADTLHGDAGHDTLYANPNEDTLIDGGEGIDTLRVDRDGLDIDFTRLRPGKVKNIEWLDLGGGGGNTIVIDEESVAGMISDDRSTLYVRGDDDDVVEAQGFSPADDSLALFGTIYFGYTSGSQRIFVEEGVQVHY